MIAMEILNFILSLLGGDENFSKFLPIINLLKENNFDIKKVLENLNPDSLAPIIKEFLSSNPVKDDNSAYGENLSPIKNVATSEIVATLNDYFSY